MSSEEEAVWLTENYPGLKAGPGGVIEGRLSFQMLHFEGTHYIRPDPDLIARNYPKGIYLCDTYSVKIVSQEGRKWPLAHETGGRIESVAKRLGKTKADLHLYAGSRGLCLASTMDLDRTFAAGFNLAVFIEAFLVPFLFEQTYYTQEEDWPWGELAHGHIGLLQWLGRELAHSEGDIVATHQELMAQDDSPDAKKLLSKRCRGHKACPCGSVKKTRDCCPDVKLAISRLRNAANQGLITIEGVDVRW